MSKIITCPYCYNKFENDDVEYQCENIERSVDGTPKCPEEADERFNDHWGIPVESRHFFKGKPFGLFSSEPKPSKCDKCGKQSSRFVCPHCHNWLPTDMIKDGAEIISIVGAPNSGKTVYFFNLMRQLQIKASSLGISVTVQDEGPDPTKKTSVIYKGMVEKMYENNELPPKTPVIEGERPIPLIFKVSNKKAGKKGGKSIYIVFYDTPGEAFQDREQMDRMADHVSNSAGILLFIDPYNIKKLTGTLQSASKEKIVTGSELENENVLNSLLQKVKEKESEDKPFAIVFSKIDAVLDGLSAERAGGLATILDLDRNSSFLKTKKFNLSEIDQISNALEEMSEEWDVEYIKSQVNEKYKEENIKMFAVSSLGSQPRDGRITDLNPYRVMDPLIWILYKIGFDIPIA